MKRRSRELSSQMAAKILKHERAKEFPFYLLQFMNKCLEFEFF